VRGLAWVLVVLYLVPLPLIPWLYAITFETQPHEGRGKKENGRGKTEDGDGQGLSSSLYRLPSTRKGGGP